MRIYENTEKPDDLILILQKKEEERKKKWQKNCIDNIVRQH